MTSQTALALQIVVTLAAVIAAPFIVWWIQGGRNADGSKKSGEVR